VNRLGMEEQAPTSTQHEESGMATSPTILALLLAIAASATVATAIAKECSNGSACAVTHTCTSDTPNAGRAFGCAPHSNATICKDRRFACPASSECGICPKNLVSLCTDRSTGVLFAASKNFAALPIRSDSKSGGVCSVISGT
jgi:hypothetical protein